ncbi:MAG: BTAD domain-containing putative transcriptional regulator [Candidatus Promineifilaceae bacterium]
MTKQLAINLFGGLEIKLNGIPVEGFISSKVPALLVYLAVTRRAHQRDTLSTLLWGEMGDTEARRNLRQALSNLRKFFASFLLISQESVQFNPGTSCYLDTDAFDHALETGDLPTATKLYRGNFLAGFRIRQSPEFEEWVLTQQIQYHERAMRAFQDLCDAYTGRGEYSLAIDTANRVLALDPWREEAHRRLMLLQARAGQYTAALAQYRTCATILQSEFGAPPSRETRRLYERILAASQAPRHNLPGAVTGFVGRTAELAEIRRLLASPNIRILSILGPGGVGKTRLALEAAAACETLFLNGVWFVPQDRDVPPTRNHLILALAEVVGCPLTGDRPPAHQLVEFLQSKELLLVVDNLEEWLEPAAWFSELLAQAPEVKILATSRQRLNLQAEQVYHLEGLPSEDPAKPKEEAPAIQLFIRRARRMQPSFTPSVTDFVAISHICQLVGGLPLGIELAAAWVSQMSCAEIATQIEASLDFLQSTYRDSLPRHTNLRGVFEWAWERLTAEEQAIFRTLAVFSGPFSRQMALDVAGTPPSILATLVDKSLLWQRADLYQLHEFARQFGLEKLRLAGRLEAAQAGHARAYATWLACQCARLVGKEQADALSEVAREFANVRQAWFWLVGSADVAGLVEAMEGVYHFLAIRSRFFEGLEMFSAARQAIEGRLDDSPQTALAYCRLQSREGRFLAYLSRTAESNDRLLTSLSWLQSLNAPEETAYVLGTLGSNARVLGNLEQAKSYLRESLALYRQTGNLRRQAVAWLDLAGVSFMAADYAEAREGCLAGLDAAELSGDQQTQAHLLTGLSLCCRELGMLEDALAYGSRATMLYETLEDRYGVVQSTLSMGELNRQMGNLEQARQDCCRAVQVSQEIGFRSGVADGHYRLGQIAGSCGEWESALEHQWAAVEMAQECGELPLVLDALYEIAEILWKVAADDRALALMVWLKNQPECSGQTVGRIKVLFSNLPPEMAATAIQAAQSQLPEEILQSRWMRPGLD